MWLSSMLGFNLNHVNKRDPGVSEVILKSMGKIDRYQTPQQAKARRIVYSTKPL